jgi:hypothetical protein
MLLELGAPPQDIAYLPILIGPVMMYNRLLWSLDQVYDRHKIG